MKKASSWNGRTRWEKVGKGGRQVPAPHQDKERNDDEAIKGNMKSLLHQ
jgi:hypothetical protein